LWVGWLISLASPRCLAILPNKKMTAASYTAQKRVAVLKALAHPTRLLLTERLMEGELCVGELRDVVGDDVSTVSKHLLILRHAGVVACQKRGLNVYYRLACDCFSDFLQCVDQVCPSPAPAASRGGVYC
jgi:DNA-binding transcriptional ArsR family regulator